MSIVLRAALLAATAVIPTTLLAQAAPDADSTASAEPANDGGLEDIVVTARKTAERLADAPIAVSAVSDKKIRELGLVSIDDFAKQASGISFSQAFGRQNDRPVIRGQSNVLATVQFGVESGAAYFIDGIYFPGEAQGIDPDELERVEIIKGPQSALYGRNTYAGAINFITKDPTSRFTVSGRGRAAEYGEYEAAASVSGPIAGDKLGFRAGVRYYDYGGQYRNQLTGRKVGQENTKSGYATLVARPTDDLKIRLRGEYRRDRDGPLAVFLTDAGRNNCFPGYRSVGNRADRTAAQIAAGAPPAFAALYGVSNNTNQYFCGTIAPEPGSVRLNTDPLNVGYSNPAFGVRDGTAFDGRLLTQWTSSAIVNWDIGGSGWELASLSAYRHFDRKNGTDSDHSQAFFFLGPPQPATVEPAFANTARRRGYDFGSELRLSSPTDQPLRGLVGLYYFKQRQKEVDLTFPFPDGIGLGDNATNYGTIENRAVFGLLSYRFTDALSVTAEVRYNVEYKTQIERDAAATQFCAGGNADRIRQFNLTIACLPRGRFKGTDPRITVDYKVPGGPLLYAVFATGRKPGGFNGAAGLTATVVTGTPSANYAPEKAKGGELGIKFDALDRRLRVAAAVYYNKLSSVQLTRAIPNPGAAGSLTSIVTTTGNARTRGFDLEIQAAPSDRLSVSATASYVDARFRSGCDADYFILLSGGYRPLFDTNNPPAAGLPLCSIRGKRLPLGSPWTVNGSATYELPLSDTSDLKGYINGNFSYEDSKYIQTDNLAKTGTTFLVNGRIGVRTSRFSLSAFGRNLTNEDSIPLATRWFDYRYGNSPRGAAAVPPPAGLATTLETGAPRAFFAALRKTRTFGVEGSFNF